jgi:hypothetical protein
MAFLLRVVAVGASALVLIGFMAFAYDQANRGSKEQVQKLGQELSEPAPAASTERERERDHSKPRELVDDANDILLAPFSGLVSSHDIWVQRLTSGFLALLAYGLGLTLLANFLPGRSSASRDWRTAA